MSPSKIHAKSGYLRVSSDGESVDFLTADEVQAIGSLALEHEHNSLVLGVDKLINIGLLSDAERIARRHGVRLTGRWKKIDTENCWVAPAATGPTPTRTVRIEDSLWDEAKSKASAYGTNVSAVMHNAIKNFVNNA